MNNPSPEAIALRERIEASVELFYSDLGGLPAAPKHFLSDYPFPETAIFRRRDFPARYFVEKSYAGDATNWWIPNLACAEAILRSVGFEIIAHPEIEVFCLSAPPE